jgi:ribosomal protein S27E
MEISKDSKGNYELQDCIFCGDTTECYGIISTQVNVTCATCGATFTPDYVIADSPTPGNWYIAENVNGVTHMGSMKPEKNLYTWEVTDSLSFIDILPEITDDDAVLCWIADNDPNLALIKEEWGIRE